MMLHDTIFNDDSQCKLKIIVVENNSVYGISSILPIHISRHMNYMHDFMVHSMYTVQAHDKNINSNYLPWRPNQSLKIEMCVENVLPLKILSSYNYVCTQNIVFRFVYILTTCKFPIH